MPALEVGKRVRIVIAGAGLIGQTHIKRVLEEPEAELAGIIDIDPKAGEQAAALGVEWATDIDTMLDKVKPDGIVIALPNQFHFPAGKAAIRAGVATLMEKPVCDTVEEAEQLAEEADRCGVPVLVGHHRRHSPLIKRAKQIIETSRLGKITAVNGLCWFLKPQDYFEGKTSWRRGPEGGVVMINLIHVIDDLRNLCGDIVSVRAAASNAARGFPVEDTAGIILTFRSGAIGTVSISDAAAAPWSWELTSGENKAYPRTDQFCYLIAGMEGSLSIPQLEVWRHGNGGNWWSPIHVEKSIFPGETPNPPQLHSDPMTNQLRHFCEVARGTAKPLLDLRGAARTLEATLAVKKSAATGEVVFLSYGS
ncbi:MAG TPA: Gfo/Idh/MocA family oxidoreductase [Bryobacteraceae bacterium]|nr:Gfo/Idh/MocA family oxidoreductase [Bryobacteraceae bacterium]